MTTFRRVVLLGLLGIASVLALLLVSVAPAGAQRSRSAAAAHHGSGAARGGDRAVGHAGPRSQAATSGGGTSSGRSRRGAAHGVGRGAGPPAARSTGPAAQPQTRHTLRGVRRASQHRPPGRARARAVETAATNTEGTTAPEPKNAPEVPEFRGVRRVAQPPAPAVVTPTLQPAVPEPLPATRIKRAVRVLPEPALPGSSGPRDPALPFLLLVLLVACGAVLGRGDRRDPKLRHSTIDPGSRGVDFS